MFGMEGEKEGVLESWSSPSRTFVKLGHASGEGKICFLDCFYKIF